jgi:hypothetical protein
MSIEWLSAEIGTSGEGEEAARDCGASSRGLTNHPGNATHPNWIFSRVLDQLCAAADSLDDVVEVVRDATRELTECLHALRMGKPRLRLFPCRHLLSHTPF